VSISGIVKRLRRKHSDNRGIALVTVIVAIGFVAALVSILLMTTLVNFKMKVVNEKGTDTFYSAEQVMDEISIGLQKVVSDAISSSYVEILEKYGDSTLDNDQKKLMIQTRYYEKIWDELSYAGDNTQYDVTKLESFLKTSTIYHSYDLDGDSVTGADEGFGAIIVAANVIDDIGTVNETKQGQMLTFADTGIVLKNIKVYYRDENGFVSVIQSDIRLNYPEFDFAKNSAMADIADYCFIADGGARRETTGTLDLDGNAYANYFYTKNTDVTINDNSLVIVKHDVTAESENFETGDGCVVWADSFVNKSSNVTVKGAMNLSNDLNLTGNAPKVVLKGEFNGYGSSITDADDSSAILINGKDSVVDFMAATKIKISGHAFLGLSSAGNATSQHAVTGETYTDIYTGETVAAKSDQLMYLVPAEVIGVDTNTGRSLYNANPLTKAQYEDIEAKVTYDSSHPDNSTQYVMISDSTPVSALGGDTIAPYVSYGVSAKPTVYEHKVRVNDASTGYLVFYYMLFPDSAKANDYFRLYYAKNETALAKYTKKYISEVKFPNLVGSKYITAANSYVVDSVNGGQDGLTVWPETQTFADLIMAQDSAENLQKFKAYSTKLVPNYSELRGCLANDMSDETSQVVFENIVSEEDKVLEYIDRAEAAGCDGVTYGDVTVEITGTGTNKTIKFTDASDGSIAIVSTQDVNINDSSIHLVITTKDASITTTSFEGVVLCNGELTFSGTSSQSCGKNGELVRKCLGYGYEDGPLTYAIASCLKDGNDYIYSSLGTGATTDTTLTGLVTYENWKKE